MTNLPGRSFRQPILVALALIVILALALAAFLYLPNPWKAPAAPLRIAANSWLGYEPFHLARDLDLHRDAPVRLHEMPSASMSIAAFRSRSVDLAALTLDEALLLAQDGVDLRVVLVLDNSHGGDALLARPEVRDLADLRGRRVGVESSALGAYMMARVLDHAGLSPADMSIVPLTLDEHELAYRAGRVDAVVTFEPVRTRLLALQARVLFDSRAIPDEIFDVLVVHADVLRERPGDVAGVLRAWHRALDLLRREPDAACARIANRWRGGSAREVADALTGVRFPDEAENDRLLRGERPALLPPATRLAQVMLDKRLLRRAIDPGRLLAPVAEGRP